MQHNLQTTVDALRSTLEPFNKLEEIANKLGIPVESSSPRSNNLSFSINSQQSNLPNINETKVSEIEEMLKCLTIAAAHLRKHSDIYDWEKYSKIVLKLQVRATSVVAKSMKDLFEDALAGSLDALRRSNKTKWNLDEHPLESLPLYQKFRSLGYRVRDLNCLLHWKESNEGVFTDLTRIRSKSRLNSLSNQESTNDKLIIEDVMKTYVSLRSDLLLPILRDNVQRWKAETQDRLLGSSDSSGGKNKDEVSSPTSTSVGRNISATTLGVCIRQAFVLLLRMSQLEFQLANTLFSVTNNSEQSSSVLSSGSSSNSNMTGLPDEILTIVDILCQTTRDILRPLVIHERSLEELCRVVSILAEDVRSQISSLGLPMNWKGYLSRCLEQVTSEAQERLVFCAEIRLRKEIELFEPLPSLLAYPDILQSSLSKVDQSTMEGSKVNGLTVSVSSLSVSSSESPWEDFCRLWYPPVKHCLSLISKLYGVVDMSIFQDFAGRCLRQCLSALRRGSEGVRKARSLLQADLFLVRHYLILREQLSPFDLSLLQIEKRLDFRPTSQAFSHYLGSSLGTSGNNQGMINNPQGNSLLSSSASLLRSDMWISLVMEGLPGMEETKSDTRQELDRQLKSACQNLKQEAMKYFLGPLDSFIAKVMAFVDDLPIQLEDGRFYSTSTREVISMTQKTMGNVDHKVGVSSDHNESMIATNPLLLPEKQRQVLINQGFMKSERIREVLVQAQKLAVENATEFRQWLKVSTFLIHKLFFLLLLLSLMSLFVIVYAHP